jgi:hypothetical protein
VAFAGASYNYPEKWDPKNQKYIVQNRQLGLNLDICRYEVYPLSVDAKIISLKDYAEETASLNNVIPRSIIIEIIDTSIYLSEILTIELEKFYPNPTDGSFTLDLGTIHANTVITITGLDGRVVLKDNILNSRLKDFQLYESPCTYMLIVNPGNERAVFKILKK